MRFEVDRPQELQSLLQDLDKRLAKRQPVEVRKEDREIVEEIARKLRAVMLCCGEREELFPQLRLDCGRVWASSPQSW